MQQISDGLLSKLRNVLPDTRVTGIKQIVSTQVETNKLMDKEGYPEEASRFLTEEEILNYDERLAYYRRFSDPRYYKGVEYADVLEALARRRVAEVFAPANIEAKQLYVNVQTLSGAPANTAVQYALLNPAIRC